jgi:hypothetical protein
MAPLDQEALARWLQDRIDEEKQEWDGAVAAGRVNAYGTILQRVRRGDLPEIDDVDQLVQEFPVVPTGLDASPFRRGQDEGKQNILDKVAELTR